MFEITDNDFNYCIINSSCCLFCCITDLSELLKRIDKKKFFLLGNLYDVIFFEKDNRINSKQIKKRLDNVLKYV